MVERNAGYEAGLAVLMHFDHAALDALNAAALRQTAQEARIAGGIELEGVGKLSHRGFGVGSRPVELAGLPGHCCYRIGIDRRCVTELVTADPEVLEFDTQHVEAVGSERMDIGVPRPKPIYELDPQFIRRAGFPHELHLVEAEHAIETDNLRDCRLADANRADRLALH